MEVFSPCKRLTIGIHRTAPPAANLTSLVAGGTNAQKQKMPMDQNQARHRSQRHLHSDTKTIQSLWQWEPSLQTLTFAGRLTGSWFDKNTPCHCVCLYKTKISNLQGKKVILGKVSDYHKSGQKIHHNFSIGIFKAITTCLWQD